MIAQELVNEALDNAVENGYNVLCMGAKSLTLDLLDYYPWPDGTDWTQLSDTPDSELEKMVQVWINSKSE